MKRTPLAEYLRGATPSERIETAELAGTSVNYLYQLAGSHRGKTGKITLHLAMAIEQATHAVALKSEGRLTGVTAIQLATMGVAKDFD